MAKGKNVLEYKEFHRRHLPHWQPAGATIFITYRLADSLPKHVLQKSKPSISNACATSKQMTNSIQKRAGCSTKRKSSLSMKRWIWRRAVHIGLRIRELSNLLLETCTSTPNAYITFGLMW
jgi:hypothetical protein